MSYLVKVEQTIRIIMRIANDDEDEAKANALVYAKSKVSDALSDMNDRCPDIEATVDHSAVIWSRIEA